MKSKMNSEEKRKLNLGDHIKLKIGSIAHGGHFISRYNGQVIFVRHAITDEIAIVKITSINSKIAFGDAIKILEVSEDRVSSPCKYALPEYCGGCDFQHISIKEQKKYKKLVIQDQFKRIANIDIDVEFFDIAPRSGLNWRTRFDFAISKNGKIGLFSSGSKKIIEIDKCLIAVNEINKSKIFKRKWKGLDRLKISSSNTNQTNIYRSGKNISGPTILREKVNENNYDISPGSFWQSHRNAPEILIKKVLEFANFKLDECVCDLYGGVGLFTLPILNKIGPMGKIHLIENNIRCIKDARKIFKDRKNIVLHNGKVEQKLKDIYEIDVIVLDPPRNGVSKKVINQIIEKMPRSIIYVSCNPASLARDTKILLEKFYFLDKIIGLDLFPMTHHIECITSFIKK